MNAAVKQSVKIAREGFINSIYPSTICQLASSYTMAEPAAYSKADSWEVEYLPPYGLIAEQLKGTKMDGVQFLLLCVAFVDDMLESYIATIANHTTEEKEPRRAS